MIASIIAAKGWSNRIPKKNMKDFCGKPLFLWSVEQSVYSKEVDLTFITSDSDEILELAQKEFPQCNVIKRPYVLTLTPGTQAMIHAVNYIEEKAGVDLEAALLILPTSPINLPSDIDNMIKLFRELNADSVGAVNKQLETHVFEKVSNGMMRPVVWDKTGRYYSGCGCGMAVVKPKHFIEQAEKTLELTDKEFDQKVYDGKVIFDDQYKFVKKEWQFPDLNLPEHWGVAEAVMEAYILQPLGRDCYKNYYNS